jgi:hypothetical protein
MCRADDALDVLRKLVVEIERSIGFLHGEVISCFVHFCVGCTVLKLLFQIDSFLGKDPQKSYLFLFVSVHIPNKSLEAGNSNKVLSQKFDFKSFKTDFFVFRECSTIRLIGSWQQINTQIKLLVSLQLLIINIYAHV